jgi:hypothetical protein
MPTRAWINSRFAMRITQDEYDKKARELKKRQAEIATRIEEHQQGRGVSHHSRKLDFLGLASR